MFEGVLDVANAKELVSLNFIFNRRKAKPSFFSEIPIIFLFPFLFSKERKRRNRRQETKNQSTQPQSQTHLSQVKALRWKKNIPSMR
ncbi:CLUMA_CG008783, isoform A [Clunio marinus]|uniref:CLUMA_CG008783, isoform A n=1 Tax=Clunio marinus TaxID=568069 RepID=A0A1J1I4S0_9DIPT|nr:CLUMA_CG008783, isoform A [Clunio marinus]